MSSDGSETSTGSRIRQFGLYRTIDARTDEFLKSSKKRQIRQGCACAAISTAITVTVVISVILVYEYSIKSDSNGHKRISIRPNWFGTKNDSDVTHIESILMKKINLDKTTLKLLPILLKALNKSRYLEKILDDYSSSSPTYETGETETYFKRNIFSDSKNWLKSPASKIFADHKTPPFIYLQNPSKRLDYLSRIRKIRHYERMLKYFDKMVNEKVVTSITEQGVQKIETSTMRPLQTTSYTTKANKFIYLKKIIKQNKTTTDIPEYITTTESIIKYDNSTRNTSSCTCPKNIGQLLKNLLHSVQDLVPEISTQQSKSSCPNKRKSNLFISNIHKKLTTQKVIIKPTTQNTITKPTTQKIMIKPITHKVTINYSTSLPISTQSTNYLIELTTKETETIPTQRNSTLTALLITVTKPNMQTNTTFFENSNLKEVTTNSGNKYQIKSNISDERYKETTTIRPKISTIINTFFSRSSPGTTASTMNISSSSTTDSQVGYSNMNFLENPIILKDLPEEYMIDTTTQGIEPNNDVISNKEKNSQINFADLRRPTELILPIRGSYVTYDEATSSPEDTFDSVAVVPNYKHPIEPLFKDEIYDDEATTPNLINNEDKSIDNQGIKSPNCNHSSLTENLKYEPNNLRNNIRKIGAKSSKYNPITKNSDLNMRKMSQLIHIPNSFLDKESTSSPGHTPIYERGALKTSYFPKVNSSMSNKKLGQNLMSLQESGNSEAKRVQTSGIDNIHTENVGEDEFQEQLITHRPDIAEAVYKKTDIVFNDDEQVQDDWDKTKSDDKINDNNLKSMLPPVRPIYLEVRRNGDWKTESLNDYEMNFANNIFDLP